MAGQVNELKRDLLKAVANGAQDRVPGLDGLELAMDHPWGTCRARGADLSRRQRLGGVERH